MRQSIYSQATITQSRVACDSQSTIKLQSINQESHIYATVNLQSSYSQFTVKLQSMNQESHARERSECSREQKIASYKSDQSSNQSVLLSDAGCVSVYGLIVTSSYLDQHVRHCIKGEESCADL